MKELVTADGMRQRDVRTDSILIINKSAGKWRMPFCLRLCYACIDSLTKSITSRFFFTILGSLSMSEILIQ